MPFRDANLEAGLSKNAPFQVGVSNIDPNDPIEEGVLLPSPTDPAGSYMYYDCTVGVMLDSGIVIHNRLPQVDRVADTLSMVDLDNPNLDKVLGVGVNLRCQDQYLDIVQRMGHSRYWFRLWGQAMRVGYQIPIPGIRYIGGVPAIPYDRNPQWAYNRTVPGANYSGVVIWYAQWSLWYTTDRPPTSNTIPVTDPAAHINGNTTIPDGIQAPYSEADDDAQPGALRVPGPAGRAR